MKDSIILSISCDLFGLSALAAEIYDESWTESIVIYPGKLCWLKAVADLGFYNGGFYYIIWLLY